MPEEKKPLACTECRAKKLRCDRGEDGKCARCLRLEKDCLLPESKRKPRKPKLRGRVDRLEDNYTEILSLLRQPTLNHQAPFLGEISPSVSTSFGQLSRVPTADQSTDFEQESDCASLEEISLSELEDSVSYFSEISSVHYPFVIIPPECDAATLRSERPMLAYSILIIAAWKMPKRQSALREQFFHELAKRYFLQSEKSLDLLQSLLVLFGWCHWYSIDFKTQATHLITLMVSLTVELGIHTRPTISTQHEIIMNSNTNLHQTDEPMTPGFGSYEARRLLIGVYIVSTLGNLMNRNQAVLKMTPYLEHCVSLLSDTPQFPSDIYLVHHVQMWRIAEQVTNAFDHGSREKMRDLSDEKIQVLVGTLQKELHSWSSTFPAASTSPSPCYDIYAMANARLNYSFYACSAHVNEVGLYGLLQGQQPSSTRVSVIYECWATAMQAFSNFLELTPLQLAGLTCVDWRSFNYMVILCVRSSSILEPACNTAHWSERAIRLDRYLETLQRKAQDLQSLIEVDEGEENYLRVLVADWSTFRSFHQNIIRKSLSQATTTPGTTRLDLQQSLPPQHDIPNLDDFDDLFWLGYADPQGLQTNFLNM